LSDPASIPPTPATENDEAPPSSPLPTHPATLTESITSSTLVVVLAAVVGGATGLLAVVLLQAIGMVRAFSYGPLLAPVDSLQPYVVVLVPALGGLLVGLIAQGVPEVRGLGVPAVMAALVWPRRALRPIVAVARPLAAALTMGTGGSAGPEGPLVHGGAALADALGIAWGLSPTHRRTLLAGASAGAIAAIFDAPLAGLAFSLEVILGGFSATWAGHVGTVGALLAATLGAVVVRRAIMGSALTVTVSSQPLTRFTDLIFVAALGVVAGVLAILFHWLLSVAQDVFDGWRLPSFVRPAVGGLAVGIMAFLLPLEDTQSPLLGPGFATLEMALRGDVVLTSLALLVVLKATATAFTVGSGGSGDVFGPALVIGGALGGTWGTLAQLQFAGLSGPVGGYALVGMVAVLAGVIHAPITAILLGWELTAGDVRVLPALVIAALVARWIAGRLEPLSVYTAELSRQGLRLRAGHDAAVLDALTVADVLGQSEPVPPPRTDDPKLAQAPIADPKDTLTQVLRRLEETNTDRLLVLDPDLPGRLLGIVRRADIEDAYRHAVKLGRPTAKVEPDIDILSPIPDSDQEKFVQ